MSGAVALNRPIRRACWHEHDHARAPVERTRRCLNADIDCIAIEPDVAGECENQVGLRNGSFDDALDAEENWAQSAGDVRVVSDEGNHAVERRGGACDEVSISQRLDVPADLIDAAAVIADVSIPAGRRLRVLGLLGGADVSGGSRISFDYRTLGSGGETEATLLGRTIHLPESPLWRSYSSCRAPWSPWSVGEISIRIQPAELCTPSGQPLADPYIVEIDNVAIEPDPACEDGEPSAP